MDRWRAIKAFIAVVESRSYTIAARQLGLSRSHVSKQITKLEDTLGVRLLNRSTKHVSPTGIGGKYYESCRHLISEFEEVEFNLMSSRQAPRGTIKLLAPKSLAILELVDTLRGFVKKYPELNVAVFLEDELLDIVEHGFNLALRFGEQSNSTLITRKLCSIKFVCCATPGYLQKNGTPKQQTNFMDQGMAEPRHDRRERRCGCSRGRLR